MFPTRGRGLFVWFVWYFRDDAIVATGTAVRASNCWSARARMSQSVVRSAQPVSLASGACSGTCRVCCSGRRRQIVTLSLRVLFSGHGQHAEYTVLHNLSLFGASEHYKGQLLACVKGWGGGVVTRPVVVQQRVHRDALANIRLQKLPPKSVTCVGNSLVAEFHGCQKVVNLVCSSKVRHRGEKSHLQGPRTGAGNHRFSRAPPTNAGP